jgi:2-methylcitrate dehydratase PrpD
MDSESPTLEPAAASLGRRWEIIETGVTVKLYPSCAATHPPLDALRGLARDEGIGPDDVATIDVEVDSMTPKLLIHPDPASGLEAKFSMPFCAGAAMVLGRVGIDTFEPPTLDDPAVRRLLPRVALRANPAFDTFAPLSQARVTVTLRDRRVLTRSADGARGYPGRLTNEELEAKFTDCAMRSLIPAAAAQAWAVVNEMEALSDVLELTAALRIRERSERHERSERSERSERT